MRLRLRRIAGRAPPEGKLKKLQPPAGEEDAGGGPRGALDTPGSAMGFETDQSLRSLQVAQPFQNPPLAPTSETVRLPGPQDSRTPGVKGMDRKESKESEWMWMYFRPFFVCSLGWSRLEAGHAFCFFNRPLESVSSKIKK